MSPGAASDQLDAGVVRDAAAACAGVARIGGGGLGVVTYLPGGRVDGVRVTEDAVEVDVVARWGPPLPDIAQRVREAVAAVAPGRSVDVAIIDVDGDTIYLDEPAVVLEEPAALTARPVPEAISGPDIAGALPPAPERSATREEQ